LGSIRWMATAGKAAEQNLFLEGMLAGEERMLQFATPVSWGL